MAKFDEKDNYYMNLALEEARKGFGQTRPNPLVGAVIVRDGRVLATGYHTKLGEPHAEVEALNNLSEDPAGATLYINLEPCNHDGRTPPCAPRLIEAGLEEVVVAMADPNPKVNHKGIQALRRAGLKVRTGLLREEAERLNEAFVTYHTLKRPFIELKWAITLDGRMSSDSGSSKWISNDSSREYVHKIRANVDSIMVGIGTVIKDNPRLNVRLKDFSGIQPKRVIVDGFLRTPLRSRCLQLDTGGPAIILTSESQHDERRIRALREMGHTVVECKGSKGMIDINDAFRQMYELEIQSVLIEGGMQLHTTMFEYGLIDKIYCFVAPKIIGGGMAINPIQGWGIENMENALCLRDTKISEFGGDVCIEGYVMDPRKDDTKFPSLF